MEVIVAHTSTHFTLFRALLRDYARENLPAVWRGLAYDIDHVPGKYASPDGVILLGLCGDQTAGGVALRPVDNTTVEIKRLFVDTSQRGQGYGQVLTRAALALAKALGYQRVVLSVEYRRAHAIRVYRSLGFSDGPCYLPDVDPDDIFMALDLELPQANAAPSGAPSGAPTVTVNEVALPEECAQVRSLLLTYGVENGLTPDNSKRFFEDLADLPGRYARPRGRLVLACVHNVPIGCGALCPVTDTDCEMKRMYILPHARGNGYGKCMARTIMRHARDLGFTRIVLSTRPGWREAIAMYRGLGFTETPPFKVKPGDMLDMVFLGLDMTQVVEAV